jgi:hypothetical protein
VPSGLRETSNNHFEIYYEHPWGGVAADAHPTDIQPNQLVQITGMNIRNGKLCTTGYDNQTNMAYTTTNGGTFFASQVLAYFFIGVTAYVIDEAGNAYVYNVNTGLFAIDQTLPGHSLLAPINVDCFQIINNIAYLFDYNNGMQYVYTPTVSFVVGNSFVGGKYCTVVGGYLITANTNQPTDNPAKKPNRYNWSSPFGFTTWDPAVDRTAGFNTLADVQDFISGIFAMGNVGYILRGQGLTQLTPTGVGIQPFDTTSVWSSTYGVGCTYPDTFAQYGNIAIWANDNNIYTFAAGAAPQEITGPAKNAIYSDINANDISITNFVEISGSFSNGSVNTNTNTPELVYTLLITTFSTQIGGVDPMSAVVWTYNVKASTWTRVQFDLMAFASSVLPSTNIHHTKTKSLGAYLPSVLSSAGLGIQSPKRIMSFIKFEVQYFSGGNNIPASFIIAKRENTNGFSSSFIKLIPSVLLVFRQEEIKLYRQPTIRVVVIKAAGSGTLQVLVNNAAFSQVVVNNTTATTYISSGMYTGEDPQVQISSANFDGYIVKVVMAGTYADGELP